MFHMKQSKCVRYLQALLAIGTLSCHGPSNIVETALPFTASVAEGPAISIARAGHASGNVDGSVIVIGGSNWSDDKQIKYFLKDSEIYHHGKWSSGPSLPVPLAIMAYAADDGRLYIAGGLSEVDQPSKEAFCLNWRDGVEGVIRLTDLPEAVSGAAGAIINGQFLVIGGRRRGQCSNEVWSLTLRDPDAKWIKCADFPGKARELATAVVVNGNVYLIGGLANEPGSVHERTLGNVERYDLDTNEWASLGQLANPGYCWSASAVDEKHVLLAGRADGEIHDEIWTVNLRSLAMTQIGSSRRPVACAPLIQISNRQWWLIGGEPDANRNRIADVLSITLR